MRKFLEVKIGETRAEIAFVPSLQIKTTDKEVAEMLRGVTLEGYNPFSGKYGRLRLSKSLEEAYVCLEILKVNLPEMDIEVISGAPELPNESTEKDPILY